MSKCCGGSDIDPKSTDPCCPPSVSCCGGAARDADGPTGRFGDMIGHCLDYAKAAKAAGKPVVGIMCEYTPRELIMAAGGVPVCLCGGAAETIGAAEEELPANLCPLIKSTFGYHVLGSNPFLEMADLIVAETTCDGKKKMYELMGQSRPMHVLQLPQEAAGPDALACWVGQLHKCKADLEARFDVRITDEKLREAIAVMNRERALRRELAGLMAADNPPLTGRELLDLKSSISGIPDDLAAYEQVLAKLQARQDAGDIAGRVRVLLTGVPVPHGAERVVDIIEDNGGLIVCMENCSGVKPILEDVDADAPDPMVAIAEKYLHLPCSVMTPNDKRLAMLRQLAEQYRPDCIIELVWQACLTYDVEAARIRRLVEAELELPYLRIETDYSPSDSARIAVRVEALFETVRGAAGGVSR